MNAYGWAMRMAEDMPQILAGAMGDYFYIACFETQEEADAFIQYVQM
jgi:hypothetical protein